MNYNISGTENCFLKSSSISFFHFELDMCHHLQYLHMAMLGQQMHVSCPCSFLWSIPEPTQITQLGIYRIQKKKTFFVPGQPGAVQNCFPCDTNLIWWCTMASSLRKYSCSVGNETGSSSGRKVKWRGGPKFDSNTKKNEKHSERNKKKEKMNHLERKVCMFSLPSSLEEHTLVFLKKKCFNRKKSFLYKELR